tara:strand:- start:7378 stop:7704 length:327 start_codon:yes stop_codon:yes gene_type:complete
MNIKNKLQGHRDKIVMLGLLIGLASVIDWLPKELPVIGEDFSFYLYLIIIVLAGYVNYEFNWGKSYGPKVNSEHQRKVAPRNLASPGFKKQGLPPAQDDIFETFNKKE